MFSHPLLYFKMLNFSRAIFFYFYRIFIIGCKNSLRSTANRMFVLLYFYLNRKSSRNDQFQLNLGKLHRKIYIFFWDSHVRLYTYTEKVCEENIVKLRDLDKICGKWLRKIFFYYFWGRSCLWSENCFTQRIRTSWNVCVYLNWSLRTT